MSSVSAIPDSNPTRTHLRLVVLGQWVRAGLALARRAQAGQVFVGGAVALWKIFQAVRLAILLARRLSELQGRLSRAGTETASGDGVPGGVLDRGPGLYDSPDGAWVQDAWDELLWTMQEGPGSARPGRPRRERPISWPRSRCAAPPWRAFAPARSARPRGRPPDRPPRLTRWRGSAAVSA
jgi:hypothetical protein